MSSVYLWWIETYRSWPFAGLCRYGSRPHFDDDQNVTANSWSLAIATGKKLIFQIKLTTALVTTGREHLSWSYLLCANQVVRANENMLPLCHPIRRLLNVLTFRTNFFQQFCGSIFVASWQYILRGSGLTYDSLQTLMDLDGKASNVFKPFGDQELPPKMQELIYKECCTYLTNG